MQRIAIIGSGISGMASSYLLAPHYDVTLYEKNPAPGGHTRTKTVNYNGKDIAVDTGFIVFNHVNYPELVGLFNHLGVATQKSDMTFGFTADNGAFEWGAESLNAVFGQRSNIIKPSFYRMIGDVLHFFKHAPAWLEQDKEGTLGELLAFLGTGTDFNERFILPMGAAIWSCPADKIQAFPARTFVQFFKNHGLLSLTGQHQWYTVTGGSQCYVDKILAPLKDRIRLASPVERVWREQDKLMVKAGGDIATYDHVVFASHADETLTMLSDATAEEKQVLGAFQYQPNIAYLHRDESVMPKRKRCWASWSYSANGEKDVSITYWMNRLQSIDNEYPLFVTLNPDRPIASEKTFDVHQFSHPIFTREAIEAQKHIPSIQGKRNIWFCGAYQRYGFHEDGLMSAVAVAQLLGAIIPWH
jgi:predicted NAD/FAD-binding protein